MGLPQNQKPPLGSQINWGHPLSKGLVGCWLFNEKSGTKVFDLANFKTGDLSTHVFSGDAISCNGTSGYVDLKTNSRLNQLPKLSYVSLINPTNAGESNLGTIITKTTSSSSAVPKRLRLGFQSTSESDLTLTMEGGATDLLAASAGGIFHNKNNLVVATWDGTDEFGVRLYSNGKELVVDATASPASIVNDSAHNYYSGGAGTTGSGTFNGKIYLIYIYNKVLSPSEIQQLYIDPYCFIKQRSTLKVTSASCALTGTITNDTEADIVSGGSTIILTLTGDTFVATVGEDNAITTALIAGIDSAQSEATGWDAVVKAGLVYTNVVRTSATIVTITLPAFATYNITATETITATVPATALTGAEALVASPTFNVTAVTVGAHFMTTNKGWW